MDERRNEEIEKRKESAKNFLIENKTLFFYIVLILILFLGAYIRIQNLDYLQGKFPLSIDDPFIFMRYAEIIDEKGELPEIDEFRNAPLGYATGQESTLLANVIVYIKEIVNVFDSDFTVQQAAIIYPVIFFALSLIFFFLFVKRLFDIKIALLASAFLAVLPPFLFRTLSGFSDKEPLGIFFMFSAFYFFVLAIQSKKIKYNLIFGAISGLLTSLMGLTWGGVGFILLAIPSFYLVEILLGKVTKNDLYTFISWLVPYFFIASTLTLRYGGFKGFFAGSFTNSFSFLVLALFLVVMFVHIKKLEDKINLPKNITRLIIAIVFLIILLLAFLGPDFFTDQYKDATNKLLNTGHNRWALTVAENNSPFLTDWLNNFNTIYLLLVYSGSILLFYGLVNALSDKKSKLVLTSAFALFLFFFTISKYSPASSLNGTSGVSRFLYIGSLMFFVLVFGVFYFYTYYKKKDVFEDFKNLDKGYIFIIIFLILNIIAARRFIRLIFTLAPITTVMVSYFLIKTFNFRIKLKNIIFKAVVVGVVLLLIYLTLVSFAQQSYYSAKSTGSGFTPQWQAATQWIREETPEDSVFAHWWDYGYVIQAAGKRATIVDPGNSIVYWNHLIGRHVLTGQNSTEALEFLNAHNATHLLITHEEIGKYGAYAIIGSGIEYDRLSSINIFSNNPSLTQETRNATVFVFEGVSGVDEDIIFNERVLPAGSAFAGFFLPVAEINNQNNSVQMIFSSNPIAVIFYNGQRFDLPLECVYYGGQEYNFNIKDGVKGCLRIIPTIQADGGTNVVGAAIYVSERVRGNLFGQMYLLNKEWDGFKLVYDDNTPLALYQNRLIGPVKIWEVNYPSDIKYKPEYLEKAYPDVRLTIPR